MKYHVALMPFSSQKLFVQHVQVKMVQTLATAPPHSAAGVEHIFEDTKSILQSKMPLSERAISAGFPGCFIFLHRVFQPRPWVEGTQPLRGSSTDYCIWLCHHDWLCLKHKPNKNKKQEKT